MKIPDFKLAKAKRKISMVTCYDASFAKVLEKTSIDTILVGDSVGMVVYGDSDTLSVDIEMIARHVKAVRSGFSRTIVADIPFLESQKDQSSFIESVKKIMSAGANAVKIEGLDGNEKYIKLLVDAGVPVMGHLGLTPQHHNRFGGFKVQGKTKSTADRIFDEAKKIEDLGCFSVVLECVPNDLAKRITEELDVPTIGIGAGSKTDGQVLVLQDLLGLNLDFKPKFVREYMNGSDLTVSAINSYVEDINSESFPTIAESFEVNL